MRAVELEAVGQDGDEVSAVGQVVSAAVGSVVSSPWATTGLDDGRPAIDAQWHESG